MDAQKISEAASDIKKAEAALAWLALDAFNPVNGGGKRPRFDTNGLSTALPGHGEAARYMTNALYTLLPQLLDLAERTAREDITNAKAVIIEEVAKQ